jgi:hypothetical protein
VKEIQNCLNEGQGPIQRGDNRKNAKIGWGNLKNLKNRWARRA